ncbi:MAG: VUT family protein [Desulfatiglandales bacterium]
MRKELAYTSIGALYVTAQVLTAIRAEVFPFLPAPYNLMFGGIAAYILIYTVANILNENEGTGEGNKIIVAGLFANALFLVNLQLENLIPESKGVFPDFASETFGWLVATETRIVFGSLAAYAIAMYLNNFAYNNARMGLIAKYLVAIGSAQVLDTVVFHLIAYWGVVDTTALIGSIGSTIIFKWVITLFSLPIFLAGLRGYSYNPIGVESKVTQA